MNATISADTAAPLVEFIYEAVAVLESDLFMISSSGVENEEEIGEFKAKYPFAFQTAAAHAAPAQSEPEVAEQSDRPYSYYQPEETSDRVPVEPEFVAPAAEVAPQVSAAQEHAEENPLESLPPEEAASEAVPVAAAAPVVEESVPEPKIATQAASVAQSAASANVDISTIPVPPGRRRTTRRRFWNSSCLRLKSTCRPSRNAC